VIEALHGYPGTPESWIRRLDIAGYLDREIAAGRMAPTVVLLPYQTPNRLLDTECTDMTGGPHAETYLTKDVPAWVRTHLRVRTDRAAWGLTGYSAGAFCAMNLLLKHPDQYAAAASLSGYPGPGIAVGDHSEKTTNDIAWRLAHRPQPAVALWLGWADDDIGARNGSRRIASLVKAPLTVVTASVPHGGHSHAVWRQMEGPAFDWLSAHLARPIAGAARGKRP
jgi:S-formylglutathione hydrolase FrmB